MSIQESMARSEQERDARGDSRQEGRHLEQRERAIASVSAPLRPMPGSGMGTRMVIGQGSGLDALDPFPALMHDDVPPHVMFPMHQHRGVEIVTYALGGALHHEDSLGNEATVVAGGAERNLFGRGYYHSEAPVGGEHYLGLQLFTVLSPEDRDREPTFQLLAPEEVPEVSEDGAQVRVVAGEYGGHRSPLDLRSPMQYLDVRLEAGAEVVLPVPAGYQGIVYVLSGRGQFGAPAASAGAHQRLVLGEGETLRAAASGPDGSGGDSLRFVVISGRPVYEGGA